MDVNGGAEESSGSCRQRRPAETLSQLKSFQLLLVVAVHGARRLKTKARFGDVLFENEVPARIIRGWVGVAERVGDIEAEELVVVAECPWKMGHWREVPSPRLMTPLESGGFHTACTAETSALG